MKILAIWERPSDKRYGGVFCLTEDSEFLHLTQETINEGKNADGSTRYIEIGNPEFSNAFSEVRDWTFAKANYFIRHFGGKLVYQEGEK